jgi:glycosyltransferase involved in cell wall biosynthesis
MKVSILLSIFNRSNLFELGLQSLMAQTMPKDEWEIVLADDMSSEDLSKVYSKYPLNIRHIRFNPKAHPNYKGYHTQSLALNLAAKHATGDVLCISQPEILHDVENLARGHARALQDELVYGQTILTHRNFTEWLLTPNAYAMSDATLNVLPYTYEHLWNKANELATPFADTELYWYIAFVKKEHFMRINGVEEVYMEGVYAEDDEWKNRLTYAGVSAVLDKGIRGIHVNHEFEADLYPKQDRNASFWAKGATRNRERYFAWLEASKAEGANPKDFMIANRGESWGDEQYIIEIKEQHATR